MSFAADLQAAREMRAQELQARHPAVPITYSDTGWHAPGVVAEGVTHAALLAVYLALHERGASGTGPASTRRPAGAR